MDFNEFPVRIDEEAELRVAINATPAVRSERLFKAKKSIQRTQKRIAAALLDIASEIDALREHFPTAKLRAFLTSECGVNRADINTFLKLTDTLGPNRELVKEGGLSFSVMKSLVSAQPYVREAAMERLASGSLVHTNDIAAIKRRLAEQAKDPLVERERRRQKTLHDAIGQKVQSAWSVFSSEFVPFVQALIDFYNEEPPQDLFARTREHLQQEARRCLNRFEVIFDVGSFPEPWESDYHGNAEPAVRLSRAYDGLKNLTSGEFQKWDHENHTPVDTDHDYLDRTTVESVLWLFDDNGVSQDRLKSHPLLEAPSTSRATKPPRSLISLEICAGAGGQTLGLHGAGFTAAGVYEIDKDAVKTLRANFKYGHVRHEDVRSVDFNQYRGRVDLVAGGVLCQPYSSIGDQKGQDDERDLFLEAVRVVDEVRPKAFFFENVKGFTFHDNTDYRAELHEKFEALGYENQVFSIMGSDYGLAQGRPRVAFIGFRDGMMSRFRMPPTFAEWRTTVGEALLDLVAANGWEGADAWAKQADCIGPTVVGGSKASGRLAFSSNLRRKKWEEIEIDPMGITDEAPLPGHKGPFKFTMAMGARLQGFPDDWKFEGSTQERKRQIANALPSIMARAVGFAIYSALTGIEFDYAQALKAPYPDIDKLDFSGLYRLSSTDEDPQPQ